jgi:capsular polysaccharide export protein
MPWPLKTPTWLSRLLPSAVPSSPLGRPWLCHEPAWALEPAKHPPFSRPVAFCFHINPWKRPYVAHYLTDYLPAFAPMRLTWPEALPHIKRIKPRVLVVWGYHDTPGMADYAEANGITLWRMEDGFLRSVGLGSHHAPPYSLVMDEHALYFDARRPSRLEYLLNQLTLTPDDALWQDAERLRQQLIKLAISKYNLQSKVPVPSATLVYGPKQAKRVLVIGQVEHDASIRFGCPGPNTNEALLALALHGKQPSLSSPETYADRAMILHDAWPLAEAFNTVDHVYTLTSLAGMEALMREQIKVTVLGQPFYSGWGLTDDHYPLARRTARLRLQALIAGVYLLYPRYAEPTTGEALTAFDVVERLHQAMHTSHV